MSHTMTERMYSKMESTFDKKKIDRINALWALAKTRPLTAEETEERDSLRQEYLGWFRASMRGGPQKK